MKGLPEFVEGVSGTFDLGSHGSLLVTRTAEGLAVQSDAPGVRVYDVWVELDGAWCQLNRGDAGGAGRNWTCGDAIVDGTRVRLWLARAEPPARLELPPEEDPTPIPRYLPVVEGAPPLPEERLDHLPGRLVHWARGRSAETVVAATLDAWNVACGRAEVAGWSPALPAGEDLLLAYVKSAPGGGIDVDEGFCRWLLFELGRSVRRGVGSRQDLERRQQPIRALFDALVTIVRAMAPNLSVVALPPSAIGPLERHRWLVDEAIATRISNPSHPSAPHRPVFVLRPLLHKDEDVLVEGVVA